MEMEEVDAFYFDWIFVQNLKFTLSTTQYAFGCIVQFSQINCFLEKKYKILSLTPFVTSIFNFVPESYTKQSKLICYSAYLIHTFIHSFNSIFFYLLIFFLKKSQYPQSFQFGFAKIPPKLLFHIIFMAMRNHLRLTLITSLLLLFSLPTTTPKPTPIDGVGTTLPLLLPTTPYRLFNDLMKQSTVFVPYEVSTSTWIPGRKWGGYNLSLGPGLYPTVLEQHIYAEAEVTLFEGIDGGLVGRTYEVGFDGDGMVGVWQNGSFNVTVAMGEKKTFVVGGLGKIVVFVYSTNISNPVGNIQILPQGVTQTFTDNFLSYAQPFNIFRFCFWQAQSMRRLSTPITPLNWQSRITPKSSTQVSSLGIALQHQLEFQNITNSVGWYCIPEATTSDYTTNMGAFMAANRDPTKMMYLEYANVYTVMNDVPDNVTTPIFETWMTAYGVENRENVLFVVGYTEVQYWINAYGARKTPPVNWTYIDAIAMQANIGPLSVTSNPSPANLSTSQLKDFIVDMQLSREISIVTARQYALNLSLSFITYSGGPYLKPYQYGARFVYDYLKNQTAQNLIAKNDEINLSTQLEQLNNDPWIGDLYVDWVVRLKNIGIKTVMVSRLVEPWIDGRDDVPLLRFLNQTTPGYDAIKAYCVSGQTGNLPVSVPMPTDNFVCSKGCVWGECINNTCVCYQGYDGQACDTLLPVAATEQKSIGMNLAGIADYSTENPFIDAMKYSRSWTVNLFGGGWDSGKERIGEIPVDNDGYPTSLPNGLNVLALISRDLMGHYDQGTYIMLYQGDGTFNFGMDDVKSVRRKVGRIQINVLPTTNFNNGIMISILRTNPLNHLRNIRVIRPGFQSIQNRVVFHPMFLSKIQPYSTLRFMDWGATNVQTNEQWSSRTLPSTRTFSLNGAPFEYMVKLSNLMGKDMWVCIPHLASDDFIARLGQLIKDTLRPDLKVYVEYSNQVWGNLFQGGQYAEAQGLALGLDTDPVQARFCFLGVMTQNIATLWRPIFAGKPSQLQVVVSTQSVNADTTKRILACQDTYQYVDGVAIAPYFSANLTDQTTLDQLLGTLLPADISKINTTLKEHLKFTTPHNLKLFCYESGQGLVGGNSIQMNLQIAAQTDPRMTALYVTYLQTLFNNSVSLANLFSNIGRNSKYGSWGHFQYVDSRWNQSLKYLGIHQYLVNLNYSIPPLHYSPCPNNCSNNGLCHLDRCLCFSDYTGWNCQLPKYIDFIQCGYLCSTHGTCQLNSIVDNKRYFSCVCDTGYKGAYCGIAVCSTQCSYQGLCVGYENCSCFQGRKGTKCEIDCGCHGHGVCSKTDSTCVCDGGYKWNGTGCELECRVGGGCYAPNKLKCSPQCVYGDCEDGVCLCWNGFNGTVCDTPIPSNYINDNLGINIGGLAYWSTQFLFRNYFYSSSVWLSQYYPGYYNSTLTFTWNTSQVIPKLPNGYPISLNQSQKVGKLVLRDLQLRYPKSNTNNYILLYDGEGVIELGMDAKILKYRSGRILFHVVPSVVRDNGVYVQILKTNTANPVRNIRVFLESDEYLLDRVLTDSFVKFLGQFSTIRFMDLMSTNGNPTKQWNETTTIDMDTQATEHGISPKLIVELINRGGRNGWVNIPHQASDDYITKFATYLRDNVAPNRLLYIQYSNEVWNTFFAQGQYAQAQATALGLANHHVFYGKRSLQIFNIFESVFGKNRTTSQLRFVISSQAVSTWVINQILSYPGVAEKANIIAIAPYFDCDNIGNSTNSAYYAIGTPDDIISRCSNTLASMDGVITPYLNLTLAKNLNFSCYEAGTSISEQAPIYTGLDTPGLTDKFITANRDSRMQSIYRSILGKMQSLGLIKNAPTMLFSSIGLPSKYGSWGLLDYSDQIYQTPTHPKYAAVLSFNDKSGCAGFYYQFQCVANCPANTSPKAENNTMVCVDCAEDCSGTAVRFQITVRIKLRVLSIVLKPSQPINPNFKPQFKIVLQPKGSRRLLADGANQVEIQVQDTQVTALGIVISAVIPSTVDTNVYSSMSLQFGNLASSPSPSGALIADANLNIDLAAVQQTLTQNHLTIAGNVVSIAAIVLLFVFMGYRRLQKSLGLLILLQTTYLLGFSLDPQNLTPLDFLWGFSYSVMYFIPSPFNYPQDLVAPSSQAIIKYGIDGSVIRGAGCSLVLVLGFAVVLGAWGLGNWMKQRKRQRRVGESEIDGEQQQQQQQHEETRSQGIWKEVAKFCYTIVFLNVFVFSIFELRFWSTNPYKIIGGIVVAILVLLLTIGAAVLFFLKDKKMLVWHCQLTAMGLVIALTTPNILAVVVLIWMIGAAARLYLDRQQPAYDKWFIVGDFLLSSLCILGVVFGRESLTCTITTTSLSILLYICVAIFDLVYKVCRKVQSILPIDSNLCRVEQISSDLKQDADIVITRTPIKKTKKDPSDMRDSDIMISAVPEELGISHVTRSP